jgi:hypothetical protein
MLRHSDWAIMVAVTAVGIGLSAYETYEIASAPPCPANATAARDFRASCDVEAPFFHHRYFQLRPGHPAAVERNSVLSPVNRFYAALFHGRGRALSGHIWLFSARAVAVLGGMVLYFGKAWMQYNNKMTDFREQLIQTLFFRVIDNNRGALAVMMNEAEMQVSPPAPLRHPRTNSHQYTGAPSSPQSHLATTTLLAHLLPPTNKKNEHAQEQRETLLAYFFLHFRWTGAEDNRFEKREPGAAMIAMGGRVI